MKLNMLEWSQVVMRSGSPTAG